MEKNRKNANRSRRHLLKAAGLVAGGLTAGAVTLSLRSKSAEAACYTTYPAQQTFCDCFLRGTRIRTGKGYRRVETLAVGDVLPTHFAIISGIRAIESFTVERDASGLWPKGKRMVRVCRGALADNVPAHDLCITEAHAVYLEGALVRIGSLVNGVTIFFDDAPGHNVLEFFRVQLDAHDVIDAEGAACESLQAKGTEACAPILSFQGGISEIKSRLRSATAPIIDKRTQLDILRDKVEERSLAL